ncbi:MAG: 1-hydroxycarotenoid 3,4-desaturase CrtD [Alphaproteobacteria bacterium]
MGWRPAERVVVVGAGMGGLAAAVDLARQGLDVTVCERAPVPGGKMREVDVAGAKVAAGPTVFTMRWIFEELFADAGASLDDYVDVVPAETLARHAWRQGGRLDLFADVERSADAIGQFAGPQDAAGFRSFCARSADIFATLKHSFIAAERPNPASLVGRVGLSHLDAMLRIAPFKTMWRALGEHFTDARLRQLFGRYATYVGSSPWLAPATLMLVAHVEQDGVWLVKGGICRVADGLQRLAEDQGARFRFRAPVAEIRVVRGRAAGVVLADGERIDADAVVFNGDVSALAHGLLGADARRATTATTPRQRSLSAITWCLKAKTAGFALVHHNVFFAEDYAREFEAVFRDRTVCAAPTVYICAQDRGEAADGPVPEDGERLLLLVNAPADGDAHDFAEILPAVERRAFELLDRCGLAIDRRDDARTVTTPHLFDRMFPATGGALYGRASHGAMASFKRAGARTRLPGLYAAGGSVHPGAGVPMATMSGRLAAGRLIGDLARARPRTDRGAAVPNAAAAGSLSSKA